MGETRVRTLGREDPLEKAVAPHSSTLAWRIPWTEEPGRLQSKGLKESDSTSLSLSDLFYWRKVAQVFFFLSEVFSVVTSNIYYFSIKVLN